MQRKYLGLLALIIGFSIQAQGADWQDVPENYARKAVNERPLVASAHNARHLFGDSDALADKLLNVGEQGLDLEIPLPNGDMAIYHLEVSPIAEQALLDAFPQIRTFVGTDVDSPGNRGRFDISPSGFRGMFSHNGQTVFIDPKYLGENREYIAYFKKDAQRLSPRPTEQIRYTDLLNAVDRAARPLAKGASDGTLKTFRIAVSASGEYTAFHGGTVSRALAAIVTAINRVNQVYENDLGIRLELVGNNNSIIFTNAATDPFNNDSADIDLNTDVINGAIGSANYDIGHVFNTAGGGLASKGVVCGSQKAEGITGSGTPTSDTFWIDFVAHEIGHQFDASHTFNGTSGGCAGNRASSTAYEPGSGTSIMAYAGLCNSENVQNNSDDYFHAGSIAEITSFVAGLPNSCGTESSPLNNVPDASAGPDVIIPANTPFVLTGSATDADNDTLTYTWEQMDTGAASFSVASMVDNGNRAIFRSFEPSTSPTRYFPQLSDVLNNTLTKGEAYATTDRFLNFRFTVRDGNGGTAYENKNITVVDTGDDFELTAPVSGASWGNGVATVSWVVASTDQAPISCANVDITLSTDNGSTFAYDLAPGGVANDGFQMVSVPSVITSQARVMVSCRDNVFFTVNREAFSISTLGVAVTSVSAPSSLEGDPLSFTVSLASTTTANETYSYSLVDVSTDSSDLGAVSFSNGVTDNGDGTLNVPSGVGSFTVQVATVEDTDAELDEVVSFYVGGISGDGTVRNDDALSVSVQDTSAAEGESASVSVSLSSSTTSEESFSFSLNNITTNNSDLGTVTFSNSVTNNNGTLTVPVGVSSFTIRIPIIDDGVEESIETFSVVVDGETAIVSVTDSTATGGASVDISNNSSGGGGSMGLLTGSLLALVLYTRRRKLRRVL